MISFCLNSAYSFAKTPINLHLANGDVLVNVTITGFTKSDRSDTCRRGRSHLATVKTGAGIKSIPLGEIAYAVKLPPTLMEV